MEKVMQSTQDHLEPFHHQVAGQSLVFRYDPHTICKSLIPRELQIYKTLPDVLKPHVPEFRGVVDIPLSGPGHYSTRQAVAKEEEEAKGAKHPLMTQRLLDKVAKSKAMDNVYHFILLENLVADYLRPCILDLKVGTRQHGDDAPGVKVSYQVNKCRSTTSAKLGVRLCGMKVYQPDTGSYVQLDKAKGRHMNSEDFRKAMRQYLSGGAGGNSGVRRDLIPSLVAQLQRLKAAVAQLPTYRFYSSSLLIVYDGADQTASDVVVQDSSSGYSEDDMDVKDGSDVSFSGSDNTPGDGTNVKAGSGHGSVSLEKARGDDDRGGEVPRCNCGQSRQGSLLKSDCIPAENDQSVRETLPSQQLHSQQNVHCAESNILSSRNCHFERCDENVRQRLPETESPSVKRSVNTNGCLHSHTCPEIRNEFTNGDSEAMEKQSSTTYPDDPEMSEKRSHSVCRPKDLNSLRSSSEGDTGLSQSLSPGAHRRVDVRMVDFAHTTYAGFENDHVIHKGVDRGCLLGLQTLIDIFSEL